MSEKYNPRSLQELTKYKINSKVKYSDINKLHTPTAFKIDLAVDYYKNKLMCDETFIVDDKEKNFYYGKV